MVRLTRAPSRLTSAPPRLRAAPKVADPFYLSAEWRVLLAEIIAERGKACEECGAKGYVIGDHIIEIRDGGKRLDKANIKLLCAKHHGIKTAQAKRARLERRGSEGGGQKSTSPFRP